MSTATTTTTATTISHQPHQHKRLELQLLIREFQTKLGNDWDKYHESLSLFLVGKLSRVELVKSIGPILKDGLIKYHNKLLLLNFANSLKDGPMDYQSEFASFWNKKAIKPKNVKSTQYEKFKQNIMGLPIRERRRIKNITKDSGKKGKLSASITLTRHALLPKIPMIQDKEQQQLQVNNLVQWQQDVVNGINTSICTDNYELPDLDNLSRRVLMTMREYGLTGGLNPQVLDMISLGLESYLSNIIECSIDVAKYRSCKYTSNDFLSTATSLGSLQSKNELKDISGEPDAKKRKINDPSNPKKNTTLHIEDLYDTLEMFPHLIEPCGPKYRLSNVMLQNDDEIGQLPYQLPPKIEPLLDVSTNNNAAVATSNGILSKPAVDKDHPEPKDKESIKKEIDDSKKEEGPGPLASNPQKSGIDNSHIGTTDELKWVLHELISTM